MKIETYTKIVLVYTTEELKERGKLEDVINIYPTFAIDGFREEIPEQFSLDIDNALLAGVINMDEYDLYKDLEISYEN